MNSETETVVTPEMLARMKEMGLDFGFKPVPKKLEAKARALLGSRQVADMDLEMKRKLRNMSKRMRKQGVPGY